MDRRFLISLAVFAGAVCLLYRDGVVGTALDPLETYTAKTTLAILAGLGMEAVREGTVIAQPGGFAYEIYYRCTGILPVAALCWLVLAWKASWRQKLFGVTLFVPFLFGLNFLRLVHLFHVGVSSPQYFELAHRYLWESAMMAAVLVSWLGWVSWVARSGSSSSWRRSAGRSPDHEPPRFATG